MTEHRRQMATLLAWCTLNDFDIDSRLKLDWDQSTDIGVYSKESYIPSHTKLVRIPRHAVLSTKSCTLSRYIPSSPYGIPAQLALSLALYIEVLRGKFSRWSGYLQSLHQNVVDIPVFWDFEMGIGRLSHLRLEDGREALKWLRGTEVERILQKRSENNRILIEELDSFYYEVAEPLILGHEDKISNQFVVTPTLRGFYKAYSLVSSRAFIVDAYHGLCMVPIADAFNHELQNHVHLESDYHVCPECGSLHECSHDREDAVSVPAINSITVAPRGAAVDDEEQENDYFMVSVKPIPPGVEIFNTYGETLTNAQLLTQYGFILEANDNDILTWDMDKIFHVVASWLDKPFPARDGETLLRVWEELCRLDWNLVSRSDLVYVHGSDADEIFPLALNGDGIFYINDLDLTSNRLRQLLNAQIILEDYLEMEDPPPGNEFLRIGGYEFDGTLLEGLEQLCKLVICMCTDRKARAGLVGFSNNVSDVGEYFDALSNDKPRTRMAVSLVLNEFSLLNSCQGTWKDLLGITKLIEIDN